MTLKLPDFALVVLIGASGSGKSTFALEHFKPTEVISSDYCRGLVSDNENDQSATGDAFSLLHTIVGLRLKNRKLTVVDATNVRPEDRKSLLKLAKDYHCLAVAIVLDLPEEVCHTRNAERPDRQFGPHVVRNHRRNLRRSLKGLKREGFRYIFKFSSPEEVSAVKIERQTLWTDKRQETGPFDIIGDVHGCCGELETLLSELGYTFSEKAEGHYRRVYAHPDGRRAIFLGDLVDRGPRSLETVILVKNMVEAGAALCVPGNHDVKLVRALRGKKVQVRHGLETTLGEFEVLPEGERAELEREIADFLDSLVSHAVLDGGKLVVAHAGMKESMQGRASGAVRAFALYGETTGETDEFGLPVRYPWAEEYRGDATVVYGHTPVPDPLWLNRTVNIDTGCAFGGRLTALRYPEMKTVSVSAAQTYAEPVRPFEKESTLTAQQEVDDVLDLSDVSGKRIIHTRLRSTVTLRAENAAAALEVMSRFAVNPKWLIYLPPTMAAPRTTEREGLLEHPEEAFSYYQKEGVQRIVCQEKHMGSRAIIVLCKDEEAARERFGIVGEGSGVCYTRTGRPFFNDTKLEGELLKQLRTTLTATNFWTELKTDWVLLDAELMPWSQKAQSLLESQYAAVSSAASHALMQTASVLEQAKARGLNLGDLDTRTQERLRAVERYTEAYRAYCWSVKSVNHLKLAPFHILATESAVHTDKTHLWHMETMKRYLPEDQTPSLQATNYKLVELEDAASVNEAVTWWETLTSQGGEGMVVKPLDFISDGKRGVVQPAIKVRGYDYLRIIYGPEYTLPENLARLKSRNVSAKRSLALREFALGVEGLERFTLREPLRRVHECVFGVLALESEPVDPRL